MTGRAQAKVSVVHFVDVLSGSDNTRDYAFFGSIFDGRFFKHSLKAKIGGDADSVAVFQWVFTQLVGGCKPKSVLVTNAGHCAKCGRRLTDTKSRIAGFGPECRANLGIPEPEVTADSAVAMNDPKTIIAYMCAEHSSILTFTNTESGNHFTYRFRAAKPREESAPTMVQPPVRQDEAVQQFKQNLATVTKPKPIAVDGEALRDVASPTRPVNDSEVETAVRDFKANSPELYSQLGEIGGQEILTDEEIHAVAVMKFRHDLSKK